MTVADEPAPAPAPVPDLRVPVRRVYGARLVASLVGDGERRRFPSG